MCISLIFRWPQGSSPEGFIEAIFLVDRNEEMIQRFLIQLRYLDWREKHVHLFLIYSLIIFIYFKFRYGLHLGETGLGFDVTFIKLTPIR